MTRRTALGLAAAGAAYAQGKPPVGIGFLGMSHSHAEGKMAVAKASKDWRILGVVESDPALQAEAKESGFPLLTREQLLHHRNIQVIAVESSVHDHAPDGLAVVQAGKHLHLEKAPADSMDGFRKIVSTARSKGLLLQVGYMWRYHPGIGKVLEAAREGWLGSVYMVRAQIGNQLAVKRRPDWGAFVGGNMFELGGHLVDPMIRLMGKPQNVTPFLRTDGPIQDNLKDNTLAVFQWDKAMGLVHGSNLQPGSSRYRAFEVYGTNGTAIVNPIEPPVLWIELDKAAGPYAKGRQQVPMPPYERYEGDLQELAAAVRGETKLRVSYDEDLMVQEALLRASGMYG